MDDRKAIGELVDLPIFVGTVLFAIPIPMVSCMSILFRISADTQHVLNLCFPQMCTLEDNMKNPEKFIEPIGVLNIGMGIAMALYSAFGFLGYLKYGADVNDAVTDNLEKSK